MRCDHDAKDEIDHSSEAQDDCQESRTREEATAHAPRHPHQSSKRESLRDGLQTAQSSRV